MAAFDDWERERAESESFASDHGFGFYIHRGMVYELRGWKSENRTATEEELVLWEALGGPHPYATPRG